MVRGVDVGQLCEGIGSQQVSLGRLTGGVGGLNQHDEGLLGGLGILHHVGIGIIIGSDLEDAHISVFHLVNHGGVVGKGRNGGIGDIAVVGLKVNLDALLERQDTVVLQQDGGLHHDPLLHLDDFGTAEGIDFFGAQGDGLLCFVGIGANQVQQVVPVAVLVVKQAIGELGFQHAANMNIQILGGNQTFVDGLDNHGGTGGHEQAGVSFIVQVSAGHAAGAGNHIHTGVENQGVALHQAQGGDVGAVPENTSLSHQAGVTQGPVKAHNAIIAQVVAEDVIGILVHVALDTGGNANVIIGHDVLGACINGGLPANHPGVNQIGGRLGSHIGIAATAGDEVLGVGLEAVVLIGAGFGIGHGSDELGVVAVPGANLIAVAVEGLVIADGNGFLGILGNQVIQQLGVMGNTQCVVGHINHAAPSIVGAVAGEGCGDAQAGIFGVAL